MAKTTNQQTIKTVETPVNTIESKDLRLTVNVNFSKVKEKNNRTGGKKAIRAMLFSTNDGYVGHIAESPKGMFASINTFKSEALTCIEAAKVTEKEVVNVYGNFVDLDTLDEDKQELLKSLGQVQTVEDVKWVTVRNIDSWKEFTSKTMLDANVAEPIFTFDLNEEITNQVKARFLSGQKEDNASLTLIFNLKDIRVSKEVKSFAAKNNPARNTYSVRLDPKEISFGSPIYTKKGLVPDMILSDALNDLIAQSEAYATTGNAEVDEYKALIAQTELNAYIEFTPIQLGKKAVWNNIRFHASQIAKYSENEEVVAAATKALATILSKSSTVTEKKLTSVLEEVSVEFVIDEVVSIANAAKESVTKAATIAGIGEASTTLASSDLGLDLDTVEL